MYQTMNADKIKLRSAMVKYIKQMNNSNSL